MKIWKKYSNYLSSGEWHIHTNYVDGNNSIDEYCKKASELGIPLIAFTEHVRRNLSYDFNKYIEDIEAARKKYDLIILSGCEAKVLPGGILDVDDNILETVDYGIFAFHSFPHDLDVYLNSLYKIIKDPRMNTWAHPGLYLRKAGLLLHEDELIQLFNTIKKYDVLIERNSKYDAPSMEWLNVANKYEMGVVRGSDCHSLDELHKANY